MVIVYRVSFGGHFRPSPFGVLFNCIVHFRDLGIVATVWPSRTQYGKTKDFCRAARTIAGLRPYFKDTSQT